MTLGFLLRAPLFDLPSGALTGVLVWAGFAAAGSFGTAASQPFVRRQFFTGTFLAANAVAIALLAASQIFALAGAWGGPPDERYVVGSGPTMEPVAVALLALVALLVSTGAGIAGLRLTYRMWTAIQDGQARMTPGRAVGYLFIPFFNFYWVFQVIVGFASDFNAFVKRRGLTVVPLPRGLFIVFVVLGALGAIPYLEILATGWLVLGVIVIGQLCDGVNAIAVAPPA
jgi:hypothetical protein